MPTMNRIDFSHNLWCVASFLLLTLVCSGQVYQATHLHHSHVNDAVAFEISAHPLAASSAHEETHHHHDDNTSHEDDRDHNFRKKIDWRATRSENTPHISFNFGNALALASEYSLATVIFDKIHPVSRKLIRNSERYISSQAIRGPPQIV